MNRPFAVPRPSRLRVGTADAALAALVVAIVGLMVVPLPTWLLDVLLASNLAISVAILLVTLYVSNALELATFPTLLLITTLVRISLNVSSTRLILLQANAGEVIRSFGDFVVRGNFVVGAVVFLILTIIQFVVVAKGSERVAEVGARFTLDALPGKQLSIDAEVRAGTLDASEARARRRTLERESHFYGAMDGAVKFVKGDVIASLLIAVVNLFGGVAIGVGQRGLTFSAAIQRYGLLTIGDGLVTQIPALLLATAAGILVTRVASEDPETALGEELSTELLGSPRALGMASAFVIGLSLVPGLPIVPFLVIGVGLFFASRAKWSSEPRAGAGAAAGTLLPAIEPWQVELSSDLDAALPARARTSLTDRLRRSVFLERGVPLPSCSVVVDAALPDRHAVISIREVPAEVVEVPTGASANAAERLIEERAFALLRSRAADFLGIAETKQLLDRLESESPATVRNVVPKFVDLATLADVLRRLVEEDVSVRDLRSILEALARSNPTERTAESLTEHVRGEFQRALTYELTAGAAELPVVLLDSTIEHTIRSAISKTSAGGFLTLGPAAARDVVSAIERAIHDARQAAPESSVLLVASDIRRFVRGLIEADLPDVRVVAFTEVSPEVVLKTLAHATVRDAGEA